MADDFPYRAEYAKSNRSSCRACKTQIGKDTLRLAAMVQSPMFDGKSAQWYHYMCFFGKQRVKTVGDIEYFENLKWEDQEKIKKKVEATAGAGATNGNDASEKKGKKRANKSNSKDALLFSVEYAKSGRAGCRGCEEKILKGEVRISKMDYESDEARRYGGIPRWHHTDCFTKLRVELEFFASGESLNGFNSLSKEDKEKVTTALPKIAEIKKEEDVVDGVSAPKKIKTEPKDDKEMKTMKKQNTTLHKYIDQLKKLSRKELHAILEYNKQGVGGGDSKMIERIADCMTFGALKPCEKCNGQFSYSSGVGYKCHGDLTEWVKCDVVLLEPPRVPFKAPADLVEEHPFLKIKSKVSNRVLQLNQRSVPTSQPSTSSPKIKSERLLPLKNMEFVLLGKTEMSKEEIKEQIVKMGGKLTTKIHDKLAAVISNQAELDRMGSRMITVEKCDIQVVPENFLQESVAGGALENINKLNIAPWGSDPKKRIAKVEEAALKSNKSRSVFTKSVPTKVTLKLKGGSAVDPDSGIDGIAHVYSDGKTLYSTVLGLTDIALKVNKYYKIQVLESDNKSRYWFFRSWGRIGTTIGDTKLQKMDSLGEALKQFKFHYGEKSGNDWENRNNFQKVPGKMMPMDLNYGEDENMDQANSQNSNVESKLPKPVQDLVSLILNVDSMKKVMLEFELDLQKMPLGKISKRQIQQAYEILSELQAILNQTEPARTVLLGASNRFYTLIPHDFGMDNPPLLDSEEIIKTKLEMLESLLDLEIAYNIMKPSKDEDTSDVHPIDSHYSKLNTDITVVEKESQVFEFLQQYVTNTHAETHNQYGLEILEAFKISRHGEEKRYKPFKKLHNKKLLWHGSRLTNYAGILSQGLRIAPPEAPTTGYMFGKGIYFADMVSKSANYCMTSPTNNTGLLMLCEVALGNMYERTQAEYVEKLPKGMHSTKGIGATSPDPESSVKLEDVEVPLGQAKNLIKRNETSLLYNEYIVYDVAQVKAQYLLKMKFNYKF